MTVAKDALLMRGSDGGVIPIEMDSDLFKGTVKIRPLMIGELNDLQNNPMKDEEILVKYLIEPKITAEEAAQMPIAARMEVVTLIFMTAGLTREETKKALHVGFELLQERLGKKNPEQQQRIG